MPRYKLIIEYDGSDFIGMQRQLTGLSVQQTIEEAITQFSSEKVSISFAGRTDSGVHAMGQAIHFDLAKSYQPHQVTGAINHFVKPHLISVIEAEIADESFHARFSAKSRSYIYKIINRKAPLALMQNKAWHITQKLNAAAMHDAAQILVGYHDLSSFRAADCQANSAQRTISEIRVEQIDEEQINIFIKAPSFLHNQVRIIVGCLKMIGEGKWNKTTLQEVLNAQDRTKAAQTAPACGLYFYKVDYF